MDEQHVAALEPAEMNGFLQFGAEVLQDRAGALPHVHLAEQRDGDAIQRGPGLVRPGGGVLLHEAAVLEHGQQPVRGRGCDVQILAGVGQPQRLALAHQPQQPQRVVYRLDRVLRGRRVFRGTGQGLITGHRASLLSRLVEPFFAS